MIKLENNLGFFRDRAGLILFFIILCGIALRLPFLNESIWYDELWSTNVKLADFRHLAFVTVGDIHPPFYTVLLFLWVKLFGDSELFIRLLPLLFGISSVFLTYVLASRFAGKTTALLAALLLSLSPVHIWYSTEARPYSALVFFLLLSLLAHLKLNDAVKNRTWFYVYFISVFACVLTHYYLIFYVFLLSAITILRKHFHKRQILAMNAAVVICLILWTTLKIIVTAIKTGSFKIQTQAGYLRAFTFTEFNKLFFNWFLLGNSWNVDEYFWLIRIFQTIAVLLFLWGTILFLRNSNKLSGSFEILLYLFVLPVILLLFSFVGITNYIERSVLVALPFFYIVLARGATGFKTKLPKYVFTTILIVISLASLKMSFDRQEVWTVYKPNPDWRSAAKYLEDEVNTGLNNSEIFNVTSADVMVYYNPKFKIVYPDANLQQTNPPLTENERKNYWILNRIKSDHTSHIFDKIVSENKDHFYLIHNKYWSGGFQEIFNELINDKRFYLTETKTFKGIEIHRFNLTQSNLSNTESF